MSARTVILIAGNRQISGRRWIAGVFLMALGAFLVYGEIESVVYNPYFARLSGWKAIIVVQGALAAFFGGLYLLLRRREVRLDPARRLVEDASSFLGGEGVVRTPLAAFDRVNLVQHRGSKGATSWSIVLRGPRGKEVSLGSSLQDHGDTVEAGLRAAAATGLPLDEQDEAGGVVRLRDEQPAQLAAGKTAGEAPDTPWWRRPSALALVAANLVPLAGVLWWDWEVLPVMQLFWLENLVVGGYTMARMLRSSGLAAVPLCAFFAVHYGGFCTVHGMFLFALFGPREAFGMGALPGQVFAALSKPGLALAVLALAVSHGVSFVTNFLGKREYEDTDAGKLMTQPYKRIVVLHMVILLGGFLVQGVGAPLLPLLILVALKIAVDLGAHLTEHRAPLLREYQALAESAGVAVVPPVSPAKSESKDINDRPLSHYLGRWRLAPGENAPPGWFSEVFLEQTKSRIAVRLVNQPGGAAGETLQAATVRGDAARVEWIEVRLRAPGRERILRFTAAGTGGERIELHEVQQPEGNPRGMQAKSFTLVRAA